LRRHRGRCRMAVLCRFLRAHRCSRGLREIRAHRRIAVFAYALGLAHFEIAWSLPFLVFCAGIAATTWAALAAIAVA
jgi:hypothetical protein